MNNDGAVRKPCNFQMKNTNLNIFLGKGGCDLLRRVACFQLK